MSVADTPLRVRFLGRTPRAFADTVQLLTWRIDRMLMVRRGPGGLEEALRRSAAEQPERSEAAPGRREP